MRSVWQLIAKHAVLKEAALTAAMLFGAYSAFWATLVFFLEKPPYPYGSRAVGLFGLLGAVGAGSMPFTGRGTDLFKPRLTLGLSTDEYLQVLLKPQLTISCLPYPFLRVYKLHCWSSGFA